MSSPTTKRSRILEANLRAELVQEEVVNEIKSAWTDSSTDFSVLISRGIEIVKHPFPLCVIQNFIHSAELLKFVTDELKDVTFYQKSNDLYHFKQSCDVRNLRNFTFISQLYDLICNEALDWVHKIFGGIQLKKDISATFSSYKHQDRLLCHDDKCEDRHIAFILYLVEDWNDEDGGALQLFSSDSNDYPQEIVKSIFPQFNTMVLFEVTNKSFHQVSEVISDTKERLSLNGWFHSPEKKLSRSSCRTLESEQNFGNNKEFNLEEYFLGTYFENINRHDIKAIFVKESEIQLDGFVVANFWEQIESDLKSSQLKWIFRGPANMRKYEVAESSSLPAFLQTLKEIFQSKCWFSYLKSLTGLDFEPSESSDLKIWESGLLPHCSFEVQRWTPSCYTLIHDRDDEFHKSALDVILRIPFQRRQIDDSGQNEDIPEAGHVIYIDAESKDEECLLHVGYKMNSLALVYRDAKTLRFTKYLDSNAESFYQIFCTYVPWKPPMDQPNLRHNEDDSESEDSIDDFEDPNADESSSD